MNIKILVVTHKQYWMPEDSVYMPIHVGREGKADIGYTGDHTGDNISSKNANYCELWSLSYTCLCGRFSASRTRISSPYASEI